MVEVEPELACRNSKEIALFSEKVLSYCFYPGSVKSGARVSFFVLIHVGGPMWPPDSFRSVNEEDKEYSHSSAR